MKHRSCAGTFAAYALRGDHEKLLDVFRRTSTLLPQQLQPPSSSAIAHSHALSACIHLQDLQLGTQIHANALRYGLLDKFLEHGFVHLYGKFGAIEDARHVFDKLRTKSLISYNTMISCSCHRNLWFDAVSFFKELLRQGLQADAFTFSTTMSACAELGMISLARAVHGLLVRLPWHCTNKFVASALVHMYVECGLMQDALTAFHRLESKSVESWNAIMGGYLQSNSFVKVVEMAEEMQVAGIQPDATTCNILISAHCHCGWPNKAFALFHRMHLHNNIFSWTSLISGLAQHGHVHEAMVLFWKMPRRTVASWTAMVAGFAQNGFFHESVAVFVEMQWSGIMANSVTYASVLPACAHLSNVGKGRQIHCHAIRDRSVDNVSVQNALIDMYSKCGNLQDAVKVFQKLSPTDRDIVSWNSIIFAHTTHWHDEEAIDLFKRMQESNISPNAVSFLGVLCACCRQGLLDEGWNLFQAMTSDYAIYPELEHYCCMVQILANAGHVHQAQQLIANMPLQPDPVLWQTFLRFCRTHDVRLLWDQITSRLNQ